MVFIVQIAMVHILKYIWHQMIHSFGQSIVDGRHLSYIRDLLLFLTYRIRHGLKEKHIIFCSMRVLSAEMYFVVQNHNRLQVKIFTKYLWIIKFSLFRLDTTYWRFDIWLSSRSSTTTTTTTPPTTHSVTTRVC
jgi:hypothetical protein